MKKPWQVPVTSLALSYAPYRRRCLHCGAYFSALLRKTTYCSVRCADAAGELARVRQKYGE